MDYASTADTIHLVQILNTQQKNISVFVVNYEDNYYNVCSVFHHYLFVYNILFILFLMKNSRVKLRKDIY